MAGRKLKALIPAKNDDVIYEQPLIYYSSQDRQYLLLVAADTPGQNMTQFIPEVSKCCFLQQMKNLICFSSRRPWGKSRKNQANENTCRTPYKKRMQKVTLNLPKQSSKNDRCEAPTPQSHYRPTEDMNEPV